MWTTLPHTCTSNQTSYSVLKLISGYNIYLNNNSNVLVYNILSCYCNLNQSFYVYYLYYFKSIRLNINNHWWSMIRIIQKISNIRGWCNIQEYHSRVVKFSNYYLKLKTICHYRSQWNSIKYNIRVYEYISRLEHFITHSLLFFYQQYKYIS